MQNSRSDRVTGGKIRVISRELRDRGGKIRNFAEGDRKNYTRAVFHTPLKCWDQGERQFGNGDANQKWSSPR